MSKQMDNIKMKIQGSILVLEIDLSQEQGPSSSGKTIIVASSRGNVAPPSFPDIRFGLNVFKYPKRRKR